ncbi:nucleotide sugar epimerase [Vibrio cholerae]|nr:CDP-abequose synthase [Vibrio cholerae]GHY46347.1 nucleotide sugar epimerase [Vibrio cholerae]
MSPFCVDSMKILISGASGYLGSQLANYLGSYFEVFALVRHTSSIERLNSDVLTVVRGNEKSELDRLFSHIKPDVVINTAAIYGRKGELLSDLIEANIVFPANLIELADKYKAKAFMHTGTSLPRDVSLYAATKRTFPDIVKKAACNLKFVNVELEHFFGPSDDSSKFISYIVEQCSSSISLDLTSGTQERDFIYIDDVISAYKILIENLEALNYFESVQLGSGQPYRIRDIVEEVWRISQSKTELNFGKIPMRDNELMYSCADTTKLKSLGWEAKYTIKSGLERIIFGE